MDDSDNILDWNEDRVHQWFTALGFPQYEHQIRGTLTRHTLTHSSHRLVQNTTFQETFSVS